VITDKNIWEKLRSHGVITGEYPVPLATFKIVVQYLTQLQLQGVITHSSDGGHNSDFPLEYSKAAEVELTERNLLGKKRLDVPV